jgi:hypothetical protein
LMRVVEGVREKYLTPALVVVGAYGHTDRS